MLRNWDTVPYLPILGMRPAEMRALAELPNNTKDTLLPLIPLRPWVGAHRLKSVLERIGQSYPSRPVIVSVGPPEPKKEREVYGELDALRNSANGFKNWCQFIESNKGFIPTALLGIDAKQEAPQISSLAALGRGLVIHLERAAFSVMLPIAQMVSAQTDGGKDVCFIIDFGAARKDHLQAAAIAIGYIDTIMAAAPRAIISISASSFPSSFTDLQDQEIFERRLFNEVCAQKPSVRLIYSDRGSARAEQLSGGSGIIPARIDYPRFDNWKFFRSTDTGLPGYAEEARNLIQTDGVWDPNLRVWGTQMIERTAKGDPSAIDNPLKATAARINLHLQLQTFYDKPEEAMDTEDDWNG